jgi:hypothetical protein
MIATRPEGSPEPGVMPTGGHLTAGQTRKKWKISVQPLRRLYEGKLAEMEKEHARQLASLRYEFRGWQPGGPDSRKMRPAAAQLVRLQFGGNQ